MHIWVGLVKHITGDDQTGSPEGSRPATHQVELAMDLRQRIRCSGLFLVWGQSFSSINASKQGFKWAIIF